MPPPAPLPLLSVRNAPAARSYEFSNPVTFGSVRAAALAARQVRQVRLRKLEREALSNGTANQLRGPTHAIPFHEKKHLKLQLNLDAVTKPEVPPMLAGPVVDYVDGFVGSPSGELPWEAMDDDEESRDNFAVGKLPTNSPTKRPSGFRPRRQSSVTLSINSPEGADFEEVAHDGPEQLGKLTKRVKRLGKGAGGTVFLSLYLPAMKLVAVKEVVVYKEQERELVKHELHALHENLVPIDSEASTPGANSGIWTELRQRLTSAKASSTGSACPYLVAFYGAFLLPAKCAISIVMEFMDMGSLQDLLDAQVSIPEPILRHCAFCCMAALEHMHRHRMIHRDIKPANILMNTKGDFKIADFGLAGTLSKSESFFSEFEGTMMYMAPERIQGQPYSYVSDLWSMGVSLFYLATGAYPFAVEEGFFGLEETIVNDPLPPMPNRFTPECRDFIKGLLRRDPAQRLTAKQALHHPFLRGYDGSDAFHQFPSLWEKMPLSHCAVKKEDVATIAQLLADFTQRQQRRQRRHTSGVAPPAEAPRSLVGHFGYLFSGTGDREAPLAEALHNEALRRLAVDCGVSANELQHLLERAIARQ